MQNFEIKKMNARIFSHQTTFTVFLLWAWEPSGVWIPFECCNQTRFCHLPIAFRQRSTSADLVGYPLYPAIKNFCVKKVNFRVTKKSSKYLNFGLDIFNCVWWLNFKGNGLASQGLDKNLHAASEPKNQMQRRLLLNVVIWQGPSIFKLFSGKNQSLLIWWNSLLVLKVI